MQINSDTFCSAPWFHIRNQQNGVFRPCCEHDASLSEFSGRKEFSWPNDSVTDYVNSDYLKYLRQHLTTGTRLPECSRCWKKESMGQQSQRQVNNDTMTKNRGHELPQTWIGSYLRRKQNFLHDRTISADIKLSNHCNFACAMCWPHDSTKIYTAWKSRSDHKIMPILQANHGPDYLDTVRSRTLNNHNYDLLDNVLAMQPTYLKILGGEPLLDQIMIEKLRNVPDTLKKNISLFFITNGSVDLVTFAQSLSGYRQIQFVVSLDGIGPTQDYIRSGSDWKVIAENIDRWLNCKGPLEIHCLLQSLNLLTLPQLMSWCESRNLRIDYSWVDQPEFLSITSIPPHLRQLILDTLSQHASWQQTNNQKIYQNTAELFATNPHDPTHTDHLYDFLDWFDPDNSWQKLMPEWIK